MKLRRAVPGESGVLTDLAHGAKSYWGYPDEWVAEWRDELTLEPGYIEEHTVVAAEENGSVRGFYALVREQDFLELGHLWVSPDYMGRGVGRVLFEDAVSRARGAGATRLRILSDPNAEAFYEKMGAKRIGLEPAPVCGEPRSLPVMDFDL